MSAALAALLSAAALAQSPAPYMEPAASTAPPTAAPPSASTETVAAVEVSSGAHVAGAPAEAVLERPIRAIIHKSAREWEPVTLRAGGDPGQAATRVVLNIRGRRKRGTPSTSKARARVYASGDARWLIVSVYPRALERRRKHFEIRLKLVEGYVEAVKAALVTVVDRRPGAGAGRDSRELSRAAVAYEEEFPSSGDVRVAALDPRASSSAFNAGTLRGASFADRDAGLADVSWSVRGLTKAR